MNAIKSIITPFVLFAIALLSLSCNNDTDTVLTTQQNAIKNYLTGSHQPRLIDETEIADSLDEEPPFYTHWELDIYRYIATYYDEGRDNRKAIEQGTTFEMKYSAYIFTNGAPTAKDLYATNDEQKIAELQQEGLNTEYEWTTEPMRIRFGHSTIVGGLDTALEGCREGDIIEVYLTYETAYGKHYIGNVPSKSAVAWFIEIVKVE